MRFIATVVYGEEVAVTESQPSVEYALFKAELLLLAMLHGPYAGRDNSIIRIDINPDD